MPGPVEQVLLQPGQASLLRPTGYETGWSDRRITSSASPIRIPRSIPKYTLPCCTGHSVCANCLARARRLLPPTNTLTTRRPSESDFRNPEDDQFWPRGNSPALAGINFDGENLICLLFRSDRHSAFLARAWKAQVRSRGSEGRAGGKLDFECCTHSAAMPCNVHEEILH